MLIYLIGCLLSFYILLFCIAQVKKDMSIVDIFWGPAIAFMSLGSLLMYHLFTARACIITACVMIWAGRLGYHILIRHKKQQEDPRYTLMRTSWGQWEPLISFFQVFMSQALIACVIASSVIIINGSIVYDLTFFDFVGISIWLIAFIIEVIADRELALFLADKTKTETVCKRSLWRYSRHPNYFGESLMWWGIWLSSLSVPFGLYTIISPLTITYLLVYVTGIPLAEKMFESNAEFQRYKQETSAFFPWFTHEISH